MWGQPTTPHPTAVVVHRNEPLRDRAYTPQLSERLPVIERVETAPQPVQDSLFYAVGRDPAHDWGYIWRYQSLAIQDWLSVAGWPFKYPKVPSALVVGMAPHPGQNPLQARANISMNQQTSYGNLTAVPPQTYDNRYQKLT